MSPISQTNQIRKTNDASNSSPDNEKKVRMSELEKMRRGGFWFRKWSLVDMTTLCWMVSIHGLAASALLAFDWGALIVATGLGFWTGIGITLGYHRLLTHQSFKTRKWLEYFFRLLWFTRMPGIVSISPYAYVCMFNLLSLVTLLVQKLIKSS